jgi:hypothetical protein
MKYLLVFTAFAFVSCSRPSQQVLAVQAMLLKHTGKQELEQYGFTLHKTPDTVVYNRLIAYNAKRIKDAAPGVLDYGAQLLAQSADSLKAAKAQGLNKTFYTVRMQRNEGTLWIRDFYLSDDNRIIGSELIEYAR